MDLFIFKQLIKKFKLHFFLGKTVKPQRKQLKIMLISMVIQETQKDLRNCSKSLKFQERLKKTQSSEQANDTINYSNFKKL